MTDKTPADGALAVDELNECPTCGCPTKCEEGLLERAEAEVARLKARWCPCVDGRPQDCTPEDWPLSDRHGLPARLRDAATRLKNLNDHARMLLSEKERAEAEVKRLRRQHHPDCFTNRPEGADHRDICDCLETGEQHE